MAVLGNKMLLLVALCIPALFGQLVAGNNYMIIEAVTEEDATEGPPRSTPTNEPEEPEFWTTPVIIGVAVGGGVFVFIVAFVLGYCAGVMKASKSGKMRPDSEMGSTGSFNLQQVDDNLGKENGASLDKGGQTNLGVNDD